MNFRSDSSPGTIIRCCNVTARGPSVELTSILKAVPEGRRAPGGHELVVDYWRVLGDAPGAEAAFTHRLNEQSDSSILADLRHLVNRGETASSVLCLCAALLSAFCQSYADEDLLEVTPVWYKPK